MHDNAPTVYLLAGSASARADGRSASTRAAARTYAQVLAARGVVWNSIQYFFVANGDAYVGFQHPATLSGLVRFGAGRYDAWLGQQRKLA